LAKIMARVKKRAKKRLRKKGRYKPGRMMFFTMPGSTKNIMRIKVVQKKKIRIKVGKKFLCLLLTILISLYNIINDK
jgi:hypothetical protein